MHCLQLQATGSGPVAAERISGTAAMSAAPWAPARVSAKIDGLKFVPLRTPWSELEALEGDQIVKLLADDRSFSKLFDDVVLGACEAFVVPGTWNTGEAEPDDSVLTPSQLIPLTDGVSLGAAVRAGRCGGNRLCIRVSVPRSSTGACGYLACAARIARPSASSTPLLCLHCVAACSSHGTCSSTRSGRCRRRVHVQSASRRWQL